jgi:uncharacterized protein YfaT (DUF1175 family)
MTKFEFWMVSISVISLFVAVIGIYLVFIQVKKAGGLLATMKQQISEIARIDTQQHDWNRRLAAQDALRHYDYTWFSSPLQSEFDYFNQDDAIPVKQVLKKFKENEEVQSYLIRLLNYYEALARGINQGIFDEQVIKCARRNAMIKAHRSFRNYIDHRRKNANEMAWVELSDLVTKWEREHNRAERRPPPNANSDTITE